MTWSERLDHIRDFYQSTNWLADDLPGFIAQRLAAHGDGWHAAAGIGAKVAKLLFLHGPALVREKLAPIGHVVPAAVADFLRRNCANPNAEVSSGIFEMVNATNGYEIIGFDVPPNVLASFRPHLARIIEERESPYWRWTKGALALALDERAVWGPIAGFLPGKRVPFQAGQTFGPNVQGLLAHLGGARLAKATIAEVEPAWQSFMATADTLVDAAQIDYALILWIARIVYHHIGGKALGSVGELLHAEIQRCLAAGV
jgi:hypothetical protein